jgi:PadR family transcriptional regulator PadR
MEMSMSRQVLGSFEYQLLSVLLRDPHDAYGVMIQERIQQRTGRDVSVGALYTALDRLEKKGFVSSRWGEATSERGGRRKRYYTINAAGAKAVRHSEAVFSKFGGAVSAGV